MKKITALSALLISVGVSAPAMAQDEGTEFSGPYVAGLIGYDSLNFNAPADSDHSDGLLYGGIIGYDINLKGAVLGIEGEYSDSNTKEGIDNVLVAGDNLSLRTGRDLYAGVRIGGQVARNFMVYAKGGYTNARLTAAYDNGVTVASVNEDLDGYRLGAGVETTMSGFTGRLEYRYSHYGKFANTDVNFDRHQVAAIIGYRF
ncbi:MAG TPA: porin family protein [Novosphingobium sp.]